MSKIGEKIQQIRGKMTQEQLALAIGVHRNTVARWESEKGVPDYNALREIVVHFKISPEWLFAETGDTSPTPAPEIVAFAPDAPQKTGDTSPASTPDGVDVFFVPKVEARLSAGTGSLVVDGDVEGYFAFRSDWLLHKGAPAQMVLMSVSGDSMSPTISNGDMVLVNQGQKDVIAGAIYAVGVDDSILVKRLDKQPGKLVLVSDNREAYPPLELDMTDEAVCESVRIIGRVLWWCREA